MKRVVVRIDVVLLAIVLASGSISPTHASSPPTTHRSDASSGRPSAARKVELQRTYREIADRLERLYMSLEPGQERELDALMNRSWGVVEGGILASLGE